MNRAVLDLWVGLFVAIGLVAIVFLALKVGNLNTFHSDGGYQLEARFSNIGGLKVRAPIKSAGVVVGRVEAIRLDPATYEGVVTLKILNEFKFPKDTIATIFTSGLLGEQYLGLEAGGDPIFLENGQTVSKAQSAVVLEKLLSQFLFSKAQEGPSK